MHSLKINEFSASQASGKADPALQLDAKPVRGRVHAWSEELGRGWIFYDNGTKRAAFKRASLPKGVTCVRPDTAVEARIDKFNFAVSVKLLDR